MKSVLLLLATAAIPALAQLNLTGQPACASPCLSTAITSVCGSRATDQACPCASQNEVGSAAVGCLLSSCDSAELVVAQSVGNQLCVDYSSRIAGSTGVASSTAAPSASTTGTGAGSVTTGTTTGTTTGNASSTITSSASLTTGTTSTRTSTGSSASGSASSSSTTTASAAGAPGSQGPTVVGVGLFGLFLAGIAAM